MTNNQRETFTEKQYPEWTEVSAKAQQLNKVLLDKTDGRARVLLQSLLHDKEIQHAHNYANAVSVRRLGYNDHGEVHARITTYTSVKLLKLLHQAGVRTSLEEEEIADFEASQVAVILGCFLHDVGMGVTRSQHEWHSITLSDPFIVRYLEKIYPDSLSTRVALRALTHEIIVGHMATSRIHSLEAGVVLVADGLDMSRGRSRIPTLIERDPAVGDIHRYSSRSITRVDVGKGHQKPVRITVHMENSTGLFQIEEVLMTKVKASPIMPFLELEARIGDDFVRTYLQ